jgi:hypothetical protein
MKNILLPFLTAKAAVAAASLLTAATLASAQKAFSAAGFYELPGSGREVYSFNAGWRYLKGDAPGAGQAAFGSAPVLVRSAVAPGKIRVTARPLLEGESTPKPGTIALESVAPRLQCVCSEAPGGSPAALGGGEADRKTYRRQLGDDERRRMLQEVERQQAAFGEEWKK